MECKQREVDGIIFRVRDEMFVSGRDECVCEDVGGPSMYLNWKPSFLSSEFIESIRTITASFIVWARVRKNKMNRILKMSLQSDFYVLDIY
jgi:hypothetical protein